MHTQLHTDTDIEISPKNPSKNHPKTLLKMPNSAPKTTQNKTKRLCDFCSETTAVVYCRADNAKLCLSCDNNVHSTNKLFTKHTRFLLCDGCDSSPASIFCCSDHSVFCQNCDYDLHRVCGGLHDRRPLDGFSGCPSVVELSVAVGVQGFDPKTCSHDDVDGFFDDGSGFFVWDDVGIVSVDGLIDCNDNENNNRSFAAIGVPSLPKDRNSSCGQHKQEILRQLTELAKAEPIINRDSDPLINHYFEADENQDDFRGQHQEQAYLHDEGHPILKGNEARTCSWGNDGSSAVNDVFLSPWMTEINFDETHETGLNSDTKSGICSGVNHDTTECNLQIPIETELTSAPPKVPSHEFTAADRVSAVSRYKEKKRTRRFEKHIRYESRKLQAENRVRVKGRFAKMDNKAL